MIDTPETDEAYFESTHDGPDRIDILLKKCRELERERNQLKALIKQLHKDFGHELRDPSGTIWQECARLQKRIAELEAKQ